MEKLLITFQTDKEMYELIRKEAYEKNISNSEVIRRACNQYFETKENSEIKDFPEFYI